MDISFFEPALNGWRCSPSFLCPFQIQGQQLFQDLLIAQSGKDVQTAQRFTSVKTRIFILMI